MTQIIDVWGFGKIVAVGPEGSASIDDISRGMDFHARDRGIDPSQPSDALDMSRDIVLDDAVHGAGADAWEIRDDVLYVATGLGIEQAISTAQG